MLTISNRFSTLLTTHALPLLDLSLYVSTQNYTTTTRPAYACLLSFPTSWSLPQKRRAIAKQRSAHLGLSSLDLENATSSDGDSDSNPTAGTLSLPHSLRKARQSISAAVKSPETASRIRLEVLTEQLLDPLATLLGSTTPKRVSKTSGKGESYLVTSTRPSTLDCLAIGYLALFLLPEVPIPFLATSLKEKYPNLADYVRDGVKRCYGGAVKSEDARSGLRIESVRAKNLEPDNSDEDEGLELAQYENMDIGSGQAPVVLPWRDAAPSSVLESVGLVLRDAVEGVPLLGDLVKSDTIMHSQSPVEDNGGQRYFPVVTGLGVGIAVIAATVVWSGVSGAGGNSLRRTNGRRDEGARLEDMGETGDLLAFGGFGERNTSTDASRAGLGVES